jgi:hypothetical protein
MQPWQQNVMRHAVRGHGLTDKEETQPASAEPIAALDWRPVCALRAGVFT